MVVTAAGEGRGAPGGVLESGGGAWSGEGVSAPHGQKIQTRGTAQLVAGAGVISIPNYSSPRARPPPPHTSPVVTSGSPSPLIALLSGGGGGVHGVGDNQLRSSSPFKQGTSSSRYKGVTLHRRSGRWESHIWVRECHKQLYLGEATLHQPRQRPHTHKL